MKSKQKNQKKQKKSSFGQKIRKFFFPSNFKAELNKGMYMSSPYGIPNMLAKAMYWLGKTTRKIVDPKHKIKVGKEKE